MTKARKREAKSFVQMTTEGLRDATSEFDREMVAEEFGTLTPRAKSRWKKASQRPDRSKARVRK